MSTLTINLTGERLEQLKRLAQELRVTPEDLAQASVEDLLARSDDAFAAAAEQVLKKNAELYRRLA